MQTWTLLSRQENIQPTVVYFDQRLCAAHPKRWSKQSFSAFFLQKSKKIVANFCKKHFFKFAPERWSTVLFPPKMRFLQKFVFGVRSTQTLVEIYNTLISYTHSGLKSSFLHWGIKNDFKKLCSPLLELSMVRTSTFLQCESSIVLREKGKREEGDTLVEGRQEKSGKQSVHTVKAYMYGSRAVIVQVLTAVLPGGISETH